MPQNSFVISDSEILGGVPVFVGTRVPVKNLFDFLRANYSVSEFLEDFPSVSRSQVEGVLEMSQQHWLPDNHETAA